MPAIDTMSSEARRSVFEVLLRMSWADGRLDRGERGAASGAAIALGLVDLADHLEMAPSLYDLRLDDLGLRERRMAYVAAAWMALADGIELPSETAMLEWLRQRMELPPAVAEELRRRARQMRTHRYDDCPGWRELDDLLVEVARDRVVAPVVALPIPA